MEVIFTDNVPGVASRGDAKNVKAGFFRNFLLPRAKAIPASDQALKEREERRSRMLIAKEQLKTQLEELKRRLGGAKLQIEKKVTAKGTLYGGVKASDVVKAIKAQFNVEVPETAVVLKTAIKKVGAYELTLNLGEGVSTTLPIEVTEKKDAP